VVAAAVPAEPAVEPVAAPETVPAAPPAPAGELDLAELRELWPAVVDAIRSENVLAHAAVERAQPVALDDGEVTLAFDSGDSFYTKKAEGDDHRGGIVEALRAVSGRVLRIRCELREVELPGMPAPIAPTDEELVDRFVAEFDAEELIDDEEGS
jgi:DNA polymerase-3 subunit gamma/tau